MRTTHTYAILDVAPSTFNDLRRRIAEARHEEPQEHTAEGALIDLHGIAVRAVDVEDGHLDITSGVSSRTGRGFIEMRVGGAPTLQVDAKKAREIGLMLIEAAEAASSDQVWMTFAEEKLGLSHEEAAAAMLHLREIRQGSRDIVHPS